MTCFIRFNSQGLSPLTTCNVSNLRHDCNPLFLIFFAHDCGILPWFARCAQWPRGQMSSNRRFQLTITEHRKIRSGRRCAEPLGSEKNQEPDAPRTGNIAGRGGKPVQLFQRHVIKTNRNYFIAHFQPPIKLPQESHAPTTVS